MVAVCVVFCFMSTVPLSQVRALEPMDESLCCASGNSGVDEWAECLAGLDNGTDALCLSKEDLEAMVEAPSDWPGLIVVYNLLMFIYYGRICLETLDPAPCGSMVTHLVTAIILGTILEGF